MLRRSFVIVVVLISLTGPSQAQLMSLEDMIQGAIRLCVSQRGAQAQNYCNCWVRRWVGLWSPEDRDYWIRTGQSTPHMQAMENVAARECGG